jgi:hypothetical protein
MKNFIGILLFFGLVGSCLAVGEVATDPSVYAAPAQSGDAALLGLDRFSKDVSEQHKVK